MKYQKYVLKANSIVKIRPIFNGAIWWLIYFVFPSISLILEKIGTFQIKYIGLKLFHFVV